MPRPASTGVICAARSAGRWCPWSPRNKTLIAGAGALAAAAGGLSGPSRIDRQSQSKNEREFEQTFHGRESQGCAGSTTESRARRFDSRGAGPVFIMSRDNASRLSFTLDHCRIGGAGIVQTVAGSSRSRLPGRSMVRGSFRRRRSRSQVDSSGNPTQVHFDLQDGFFFAHRRVRGWWPWLRTPLVSLHSRPAASWPGSPAASRFLIGATRRASPRPSPSQGTRGLCHSCRRPAPRSRHPRHQRRAWVRSSAFPRVSWVRSSGFPRASWVRSSGFPRASWVRSSRFPRASWVRSSCFPGVSWVRS